MFFQKAWSGMNLARTSLVGQWLGLHASTAGNGSSVPWSGTKILQAAWHGQKTKKRTTIAAPFIITPNWKWTECPARVEGAMCGVLTQSVSQFSSVAHSCPTLLPHGLKHARPPCPSPTPGVYPNPCPLSRWCHPTISSSVSSPSPPALNLSQHQGLFKRVNSSHEVAKVLELQLQHQSLQWVFRTDLL